MATVPTPSFRLHFSSLSAVIPVEQAVSEMQEAIYRTYFQEKGQAVVDMNNASIEKGLNGVHKVEIPAAWLTAEDTPIQKNKPAFIQEVVDVMNRPGGQQPASVHHDEIWPGGRHLARRHLKV